MRQHRFVVVAKGLLIAAMLAVSGCTQRNSTNNQAPAQRTKRPTVKPAPPDCPACAMGLTADFVFKRLDTDKDRKVTVKEFGESPGIHEEAEARDALGRIDTDHSGTLSWEEFETAYGLRHAKCKKVAATTQPGERGNVTRFARVFIMRNDKNGDGKVDKTEFRGSASRFDQMDKNANGFLDPEELKDLHARRMADPRGMRERLESGDVRRPPPGGIIRKPPATVPTKPDEK